MGALDQKLRAKDTDGKGLSKEDFTTAFKAIVESTPAKFQELSGFAEYTPTLVDNSFITKSTGLTGGSVDYRRTAPIPLSNLGSVIKIDIGTFGGSIAPIAYYTSTSIATGNYISSSEITTVGGSNPAAGQQLTGFILTPPANATHVVFSSHKNFNLKIYSKTVDQATKDGQTAFVESALNVAEGLYNNYTNPFASLSPESDKLFRRGAKQAAIGSDVQPMIIVAGQSGADGRIPVANAPAWLTSNNNKIDNYMMWNRTTNAFQSYQLGVNTGALNNTATTFAFDIYFAKAWLDANPGKKLYAIRQSAGGVPISEKGVNTGNNNYRWQPKTELIVSGQLSMTNELVAKIAAVKQFCTNTRLRLYPLAVLFDQGEGDADRAGDGAVADYPVNLANLFSFFRGLFQAPALPIFHGTIVSGNTNYNAINTAINQVDSLDPFLKAIDMSSRQTFLDGLHYDANASEFKGQQMYNNLLLM
ncbi:sialate O-acetylesterase [Dyadobacter flavalbus]|uniref:Sialate O-acetylesterase n=1 Tax=Dyadobacter flavalbus TaxID=2579942 RepID=A0A5M8R2A8_9BACT|nr:sialate O-acetylesterase [Dyadobacter flavalbus]KAA6441450.1 sialate O-acetylesterase [Dyadobacter flavalbus]